MQFNQLQTNPVCPKCKKGHTMRVVGYDVEQQIVYYQTDCRKLPLKIQASDVQVLDESQESFYFYDSGWITYRSTHGNYTYQLTKDLEENAYALNAAYEGVYGIYHEPIIEVDEDEIESEEE